MLLAACATAGLATTVLADAGAPAPIRSAAQNWVTPGADAQGTYYSPLDSIDAANVKNLGFAWQYDLGNPQRGQEATPVVLDGVLYTSGTWGYVYAVDAATGRERWRYDPHSDFFTGRHPCCDLVNRGVAVTHGKVYVAAGDGRLHAIDAATGKKLWVADTIVDRKLPYSSTGAPLIAGNLIVIGNSGADMGHVAVRGYVSAYDLDTGAFKWRFFTVPPAPGHKPENPELIAAAKTWDAKRPAEFNGGGTAWDGFAYDPSLNLVYFGTANAAPYDLRQLGSARLDGLYTASIIALHADSGRMAWYYQTTPRDSWDFDAVQKLILADVEVEGAPRPVIMQANKNGFFYVLDRATGKLVSAKNFTYVNWAKGVDPKTGRPILTPQSDWYSAPKAVYPSWFGGHTWNPMSLSAQTHLVYIPVIDQPAVWIDMPGNGSEVKYLDGFFTANGIIADDTYDAADLKRLYGPLPDLQSINAARNDTAGPEATAHGTETAGGKDKPGHPVKAARELIRAWDPVAQKTVWEHETSAGIRGYDGGISSTAGNLVFQGRGSGDLWVYAADTGKVLKVIPTGSHIMAAPAVYAVGGEEYVAVQTGYGGAAITIGEIPKSSAAAKFENTNRIIAFKLGGGPVPPPTARVNQPFEQPPPRSADADAIRLGEIKFIEECSRCHVLGLSSTPDLRRLNAGLHAAFKDIVLHGALAPAGMERFDDILSEADVEHIHAYLIDQSWVAYDAQQAVASKALTSTGR